MDSLSFRTTYRLKRENVFLNTLPAILYQRTSVIEGKRGKITIPYLFCTILNKQTTAHAHVLVDRRILPLLTALPSDWLVWSPTRTPIGCFWITSKRPVWIKELAVQRDITSARSFSSSSRNFIKISEENRRVWIFIHIRYSYRKGEFLIYEGDCLLSILILVVERFKVAQAPLGKKRLSHLTSICSLYLKIIFWMTWFTNIVLK